MINGLIAINRALELGPALLYDCAPHHQRDTRTNIRTLRQRLTVDVHCHVHTPDADELIPDRAEIFEKEPLIKFTTAEGREIGRRFLDSIGPKLTSVAVRLADMDSAGIDIQAISPSPFQYYYWTDPEIGRETSRLINDNLASIVAAHPDRFVAIGTVPLQEVSFAVAELERMVRTLDMRGVELSTNINGTDLDDPKFKPFFQKVQELGIFVFLHPAGFSHGEQLRDYYLNNTVGQPLEEAIAISRLIFSGTLAAFPRLKICVAHGGGYLPTYFGRMDHAYRVREDCRCHIDRPPSEYLKQLYVDTLVFDPDGLGHLIKQMGAHHVLLGTDYPYDMSDQSPLDLIARVNGLSSVELDAVCGLNAATLLNIDVASLTARGPR